MLPVSFPLREGGGELPLSQSPIHRECFCYANGPVLPRLASRRSVAIPYSSGMLLLRALLVMGGIWIVGRRNPLFIGNAFATGGAFPPRCHQTHSVAIPYSSGMLLLLDCLSLWSAPRDHPVAIPYSSGMLLLHCKVIAGKRSTWRISRNPLFIGNAFATHYTPGDIDQR